MKSILLIEDRSHLQLLYTFNLRVYVDGETTLVESHQEALEKMVWKKFDLIICRQKINNIQTAVEVHKFLKENDLSVPMVVLGEEKLVEDYAVILQDSPKLRDLIRLCGQALGVTAKKMAAMKLGKYYSIPTTYFKHLEKTEQNIYQELYEGGGDQDDMNVVFSAGEKVNKTAVGKLLAGKIEKLYILANERVRFAMNFAQSIEKAMADSTINLSEKGPMVDMAMEYVAEKARRWGIDEEATKIAKIGIQNIIKIVEGNTPVNDLLRELFNHSLSYRYKHCQLIMLFSGHILKNMTWGTRDQIEKLAFVAFFHDLPLADDNMVKIHSDEDLEGQNLSDADKLTVQQHAQLASTYAKQIPKAPTGVDVVILQHHGVRNGIGFKGQAHLMSPLAMVFMMAEECAHYILGLEGKEEVNNPNKEEMKRRVLKKFPSYVFRKMIESLDKLSF